MFDGFKSDSDDFCHEGHELHFFLFFSEVRNRAKGNLE
jgi:hypothetical protein